ncbi:Coproporphyrinogen-III oxidase [Nowakowskiella sp. JEL0407]|nr:Coproporphyrinogen-III oxidase [Nowakowskiella sp. JEL0407]
MSRNLVRLSRSLHLSFPRTASVKCCSVGFRSGLALVRTFSSSGGERAQYDTYYKTGLVAVVAAAVLGGSLLNNAEKDKLLCEEPHIEANANMREKMEEFVRKLQLEIVEAIEGVEGESGGRFKRDEWLRKEGGMGRSCVLQEGKVFEKAGVGVSVVHGPLPPAMHAQMRARNVTGLGEPGEHSYTMFAAGISLVMHPHNPNAPTVHLNYRYFEIYDPFNKDAKPVSWWFGGGCDLTPSYLYPEDAEHFHKEIKAACDKHDKGYYSKFKKWCDEYFFIPHRGEARGIGGIFFDDLDDKDPEKLFAFVKDCGHTFVKQYVPILHKRKDMPFTEEMKKWQQLRRGRYAEFNLVYDRGTKFGLATPGARIESILMSLPLTARWEYMHSPEKGSREDQLLDVLKTPKEWVKKGLFW